MSSVSIQVRSRRAGISGINVTPMVDVVLVLLVIMMVSGTYIVSRSLNVELPKAGSASDSVASVAAVTIAKDGKLYFNQEPIDEPSLVERFREAGGEGSETSLIVSADKDVSHGAVVRVIDLAKGHGIVKFAINVETTK